MTDDDLFSPEELEMMAAAESLETTVASAYDAMEDLKRQIREVAGMLSEAVERERHLRHENEALRQRLANAA